MTEQSIRQAVLIGVILGMVAGGVVWWLRRFENEAMHEQMRDYLSKWDRFRQWEIEHGGGGDA